LPCLAWAQYPSNGNQKITLGEQTTADGLIYRGVASTDTVRKPSIDTMAYMVLDTTTNIIWHYKKATSNAWLRLNLLPSDTASMLTPYWRSGRFSGVLPVANGGTNASTFTAGSIVFAGSSGTYTQDNSNLFWDNTNKTLGIGTTSSIYKLIIKGGNGNQLFLDNGGENFTQVDFAQNGIGKSFLAVDHRNDFKGFVFGNQLSQTDYRKIIFRPDGSNNAVIINNDEMLVGYTVDQGTYKLQVNSQIFATNATIATSDIRFKENIKPLDKGLEIINKLKPVKFNFITTTENNFSEFDEIGFIAQDVEGALSTELCAKAVVKKLNEDKDDSALGLMTEKLIPILVKAIQEQQALIKALEQRIINLENK
jgi:hypothetical protein